MSDTKQAAGWWKASDGKWYAPELAARPGKYHSDDSEAMILAAWGRAARHRGRCRTSPRHSEPSSRRLAPLRAVSRFRIER